MLVELAHSTGRYEPTPPRVPSRIGAGRSGCLRRCYGARSQRFPTGEPPRPSFVGGYNEDLSEY